MPKYVDIINCQCYQILHFFDSHSDGDVRSNFVISTIDIDIIFGYGSSDIVRVNITFIVYDSIVTFNSIYQLH